MKPTTRLKEAMLEVSGKGLVWYDDGSSNMIFLPNGLRIRENSPESGNAVKTWLSLLGDIPKTAFVNRCFEHWRSLRQAVDHPLTTAFLEGLPKPSIQEQEKEQEKISPPNGNGGPSLFPLNGKSKEVKKKKEVVRKYELEWVDQFWEAYPNKQWRVNVDKAFEKINPDRELFDRIAAGLEKAKRSEQWAKDGGAFIPHPAKWLELKGWENVYAERRDAWQYAEN